MGGAGKRGGPARTPKYIYREIPEDVPLNEKLSSRLDIPYRGFSTLPATVRENFDGLSTVVNISRMLGYDAFKGVYEKAGAAGITMVQIVREVADQADEAMISMVRDYPRTWKSCSATTGCCRGAPKG